ncbi:MAG: 3-oxoacyl-ACP synthase [Myxococcales bacterium]|nr:3-oxoacyl-ACP synthase [Myxococcales bacterium]MDD9969368.1 3-oxoacyl-ACP synthase [Myxococcales bacterium]
MTRGITIVGSGHFVPGSPVSNHALERVMKTDHDWIVQRTGIAQRHFAAEDQAASDLAVEAAKRALEDAGLAPEEVDYVIFATMTPDHLIPGAGGVFSAKLGIAGVPTLDIRQQCAAIPFALELANGLVSTGAAETILLVGAEAHAGFMPWSNWPALYDPKVPIDEEDFARATRHRGIAVVFGDGAGAWILRASDREGSGFLGSKLRTDGRDAEFLRLDAPWRRGLRTESPEVLLDQFVPSMNGPGLFKRAVRELPKVIRGLCRDLGVDPEAVDCFVAHQANDRINEAVRGAMGLPAEKMPSNIARYGNTSAGTIPILMDELRRTGQVKPGDLICMLALGAGLHYGASLMRL